jgi:hypothetical protein
LTPPLRLAARLAALALVGCAAAPAVPPPAPASAETTSPKSDPLPVAPLPVPAIVIVQSPPAPPSTPPPPSAPPVPAQVATAQPTLSSPANEEEQQALALLADLQRYASDPADDLRRELVGANAALARTRSDANRIRVAMLLTLPAAGPPDDTRALTLLEPLVVRGNSATSPLKQIASVLYAQIIERARSVKEEQRRTAAAQEKLDALRAVERSLLLERSRNAGGGAGGGGGGTGR